MTRKNAMPNKQVKILIQSLYNTNHQDSREKMYRLNYELQQIFVVATLEKQTMFKEVKKLNNDFQQLFIVVRKR